MLLVFFVFKRQDLLQPKLRSAATEPAFSKRPEDSAAAGNGAPMQSLA